MVEDMKEGRKKSRPEASNEQRRAWWDAGDLVSVRE